MGKTTAENENGKSSMLLKALVSPFFGGKVLLVRHFIAIVKKIGVLGVVPDELDGEIQWEVFLKGGGGFIIRADSRKMFHHVNMFLSEWVGSPVPEIIKY